MLSIFKRLSFRRNNSAAEAVDPPTGTKREGEKKIEKKGEKKLKKKIIPLAVVQDPAAAAEKELASARPSGEPGGPAPDTADSFYDKGMAESGSGNNDQALACFESALRLDPSHTNARAEFGRLRFQAPPQPLLHEIRQRNPVDVCEVVVEVRNACNYRCFYCVGVNNKASVNPFDLPAVEKSLQSISAELVVISFDCGGGEPTVHPQFPELLRLCATRGPVSFPTNNSQNPERWLPKEVARRIYIRAALHPESEETLEKYVRNARYLMEAGCDFSSLFVSHPTRMSKIPYYRQYFADAGVPFTPVSFIGEHEGRRYPHAYSDEEKEMLGLNAEDRSWFHRVEPHATRIRNFRGIPCLAGFRSIFITPSGAVRRCHYDKKKLLIPLDNPEPCRVKNCGCGLQLEKLNSGQSVEFHNSWAPKAGIPLHDVTWMSSRARELGYAGVQEGLAAEHTLMYDELMRAYGKDDFPEA
jgi:MoaA/NifB/PqqE/SkfB family radical SAM enzyme